MQEIQTMLEQYKYAISTQRWEDFAPLWAEGVENVLISPTGYFVGTREIYEKFLMGGIHKAYSRIELISRQVDIRQVGEHTVSVVFSYTTDCDRRESGEFFSISGLETQTYVNQGGHWKLTHVHYSVQ